jgi:cyclic pyranopterin phosphate synthase
MEKGEVISIAEISGIQAAKKASDLIPLINPVDLTGIDVKAYVYQNGIEVKSHVRSECRSSLEIEALSAVSVALLTLYEMCKSVDHTMTISDIKISKKIQE